MAALRVAGPPVATLSAPHRLRRRASCGASRRSVVIQAAHTVTVEHRGKTHTLTLDDDTTILEAALDAGVDLPHDCKARDGSHLDREVGAPPPVSASPAQTWGLRPAAAAASIFGAALWRTRGSDAHPCVRLRVAQLRCSGSSATHTTRSPPAHADGRLHDLPRQACEVRRLGFPERRVVPVLPRREESHALTQWRLLHTSAAARLTRAAAACSATTCERRASCYSAAAGRWVTAR